MIEEILIRNQANYSPENHFLSNSFYRSFINSLKFGVVIVESSTSKIVEVNSSFLNIFGEIRHLVIDKTLLEIEVFEDEWFYQTAVEELLVAEIFEKNNISIQTKQGLKQNIDLSVTQFSSNNQLYYQFSFDQKKELSIQNLLDFDETINQNFQLAAIVDSSEDAIISKSFDGTILSWNQSAEKIFGYSSEEVIGKNIGILFPAELLDDETEIIRKIRNGESIEHYETTRIKKDGTPVSISLTISPIKNSKGEIIGVSKVARDITKLKIKEKKYKDSQMKLNALIQSTSQTIWEFSAKETNVETTNWFSNLTGKSIEELSANGWFDVIHPKDRERIQKTWESVIANHSEVNMKYRVRKSDGNYISIAVRGVPIFTDDGQFDRWFGTISDVTEKEKSLTELEKSEEKYRLLFFNNPFPMWLYDTETLKFTAVNSAAISHYGYTEEEFLSMTIKDIRPDEDVEKLLEDVQKTTTDLNNAGIWRHRKKDGSIIFVEVKSHKIFFDSKEVRLVLVNDITDKKFAEEQLIISEQRYRALSSSASMVWQADENGFIKHPSSLFSELTGVEVEPDMYWWLEGIHPDEREITKQKWNSAIENKTVYEIENRLILENGDYRHYFIRAVPIIDNNGEVREWVGMNLDISERKVAEIELIEREKMISAINNAAPNLIILWDVREGVISYINNRVEQILGYDPEFISSLNHRQLFGLIHPEEIKSIYVFTEKLRHAKPGSVLTHKYRFLNRKGEWRIMKSQDTVFELDKNEKAIKVLSVVEDITEQTKSEQKLRESEERLSNVIENLSEGLIISDLEGKVLQWNPASLEIHSFAEGEQDILLPRFSEIFELYTLDGELVSQDDWLFARIFRGEILDNVELILRRTDIEWERIFSYGGRCINQSNGEPLAFLTIVDITERKKAEEEIIRLNETLENRVVERTIELESANKELEAFSYSVSHDLRAPLRAMDGFSLALIEDYSEKIDEEGQNYLNRVRSASQQMARLIDDMIKLSRVSRGEINKQYVNLSEIVRSITDKLQEAEPKDSVSLEIEERVFAHGDERLIRIALENLVGNAWKFTSKKSDPVISFGQIKNNGNITYFIKDNGAGFDMNYAGKLFGAFQRLHSNKEFEGTGIGLATVQRIIRRHGGQIWAESEVGKRTVFYFKFWK